MSDDRAIRPCCLLWAVEGEAAGIEFADRDAVDAYLGDPRRTVLALERDRVVARTELFPVRLPRADGGAA